MMRFLMLLCSVFLFLINPAFAQNETERVAGPLTRLFPHLQSYRALDPEDRTHFQIAYIVSSNRDVPSDDIQLWYETAAADQQYLSLDERGRVITLPASADLEAAPDLWVNQPQGTMSVSLTFEALLPLSEHYNREDLILALNQATNAVDQAAGIASFLTPDIKEVAFIFDGPAPDAWIVGEDGERTSIEPEGNQVNWRPNRRASRRALGIAFAEPPARIVLQQ